MSTNAVIPITMQVGHGAFRQRSPISDRRITRFEAVGPSGSTIDLRKRLHAGGATQDGDIQFKNAGSYVLVLQTDNRAQTHLPSIRFNDYLRTEGLTPALEQRTQLGRMDFDGSERYSRCAKSIVRVGLSDTEAQDQISKPVGLPLEIVPDISPYGVARSATLPVRVIYEGHPLAGATVKLTDLANDASPFEVHVSDTDGRASFVLPNAGTWMLNVIWTKPLPRTEETDFETIFSSLSFGFPPTTH